MFNNLFNLWCDLINKVKTQEWNVTTLWYFIHDRKQATEWQKFNPFTVSQQSTVTNLQDWTAGTFVANSAANINNLYSRLRNRYGDGWPRWGLSGGICSCRPSIWNKYVSTVRLQWAHIFTNMVEACKNIPCNLPKAAYENSKTQSHKHMSTRTQIYKLFLHILRHYNASRMMLYRNTSIAITLWMSFTSILAQCHNWNFSLMKVKAVVYKKKKGPQTLVCCPLH